jgi:hypothetical protein
VTAVGAVVAMLTGAVAVKEATDKRQLYAYV